MVRGISRTLLGFADRAGPRLAPMALAQDAPVRVRGTIERVEGDTYIVKARNGDELKVKLAEKAGVSAVIAATLADIKPGTYVGIAGMPQTDGSQKALEVLIFPEAMRGAGDGHRGWDLQASSTMTNGNVEQSAVSTDGQVLTIKYKDGEKKIVVPSEYPDRCLCAGRQGASSSRARRFSSPPPSSSPTARCKRRACSRARHRPADVGGASKSLRVRNGRKACPVGCGARCAP